MGLPRATWMPQVPPQNVKSWGCACTTRIRMPFAFGVGNLGVQALAELPGTALAPRSMRMRSRRGTDRRATTRPLHCLTHSAGGLTLAVRTDRRNNDASPRRRRVPGRSSVRGSTPHPVHHRRRVSRHVSALAPPPRGQRYQRKTRLVRSKTCSPLSQRFCSTPLSLVCWRGDTWGGART